MATETDQPNPSTRPETAPHRYTATLAGEIETRWQGWWEAHETFRTPNPGEEGFDGSRPKFYCLDMFPYPSGAGLHVGHPEGYTATDIVSRYKRMTGHNVLHPMGWDAFGLPAEQYAIQTGVHPVVTTRRAIDNFRRQLRRFGFSYDWSREFGTIDEDYYRWTQWVFLRIYNAWFDTDQKKARPIAALISEFESGAREVRLNPDAAEYIGAGDMPGGTRVGAWGEIDEETRRMVVDSYRLAYVGRQTVNWCPKLGTALANEEVIDGKSERGGYPVLRKPMRQWMFRITAYADRLLDSLADVEWPESTKTQQAEWIGRSEGAEVDFAVLEGTPGGSPLRGDSASSPSTPPASEADVRQIVALLSEKGYQAFHPIGFQPRDPYPEGKAGPVPDLVRFDRLLPHLRLPGATYFVTWKTVEGIELEDAERDVILDAIRHFDGGRCRVYAAVVMSNHVHWMVRPFEGHTLDDLVTSVKRFASKEINEGRGRSGHVWHAEQFDHIVRDAGHFAKFVEYVVQNPVEAGVAAVGEDYRWVFVHRESVGGGEEGVVPEGRSTRGAPPEGRGTPGVAPEGRSTLVPTGQSLRVFTTRPDTIFGATYMVVAPEHPLVDQALDDPAPGLDGDRLREYVERARNRSDIERMEAKDKTGCFTGVYVRNPATGEPIPVWTSDYVLMGYGTGAIMAVPAHDERDFAFATAFGLEIRVVVAPEGGGGPSGPPCEATTQPGVGVNSANDEVSLDGLPTAEAKRAIIGWLERTQLGMRHINYRLRDWLFSRQRYWGEPIPIVWDRSGHHHPVSEGTLPVRLPDMTDYAPVESDDPQPLLAKAVDWVESTAGEVGVAALDADARVTRETNTMPGWAGSCWYFLRYCDPKNGGRLVGEEAERYWMGGVDRLSEPMRFSANAVASSRLDQLPHGAIAAAGFLPRDPYPAGDFGPARDLSRTARNLPHYELPGATYFVTWRATPDRELAPGDRDTVLRSLLHFDGERCRVYAACVMPDHVHWLVRPFEGHTLGGLVSSVKRFSARAVNAGDGDGGSLWQADRFDHVVRDEKWFGEFLRYIVQNPVEAGLTPAPSGYRWTWVHTDALRGAGGSGIGSESRSTRGGVDLYVGGSEHAVLHLLYARFWHKVLFDLGEVSTDEPFKRLFHQGLITSHAYQRADRSLVPVDEVDETEDGGFIERATGARVAPIVAKMSKSLKNVVNPDDVIHEYGADTFRLYEMYMGPLEASKPWNTNDTIGLYRFLQRTWRLVVDEGSGAMRLRDEPDPAVEKQLHRTIAKAGADIEKLAFNTGIAAMIEFVNAATGSGGLTRDQLDRFCRVLSVFAPHMGEELWHRLGHEGSVAHADWPDHDDAMLRDDEVEIVVQLMGKVKAKLMVPADADAEALEAIALADGKVREILQGKTVRKVIAVPGRLVNIVAS